MMTKEEILQAAEYCATNNHCENCPAKRKQMSICVETFAKYIFEKEPTPAATEESSKVENSTNNNQLNDSTKRLICQVNEVKKILATAELDGLSDGNIFMLGEMYGRICAVLNEEG